MIAWLKKKLGYHVCETFTQWEVFEKTCQRAANMTEHFSGIRKVNFVYKYQQRKCVVCGKTQQEKLTH